MPRRSVAAAGQPLSAQIERIMPDTLCKALKLCAANLHGDREIAAQRGWTVRDGIISFEQSEDSDASKLPSLEIIDNALTYAREIERIV